MKTNPIHPLFSANTYFLLEWLNLDFFSSSQVKAFISPDFLWQSAQQIQAVGKAGDVHNVFLHAGAMISNNKSNWQSQQYNPILSLSVKLIQEFVSGVIHREGMWKSFSSASNAKQKKPDVSLIAYSSPISDTEKSGW